MATPDKPCLSNSLTLAAVPAAVKLSRTLVAVTLKSWSLGRIAEEAELVISELATNAVRATGTLAAEPGWPEGADLAVIRVRIVYLETRIALEVWDSDPAPPKPTDAGPDAENGRGLAIIDALCARWDYVQAPGGGKVVFAELAIPPRGSSKSRVVFSLVKGRLGRAGGVPGGDLGRCGGFPLCSRLLRVYGKG